MIPTELALENALYSQPWLLPSLDDYRLMFDGWIARQYSVPSGRIDLLGRAWNLTGGPSAIVVELKRGAIDEKTLCQASRYAADIRHVLETISDDEGPLTIWETKVFVIVVGYSISRACYMAAMGMEIIPLLYTVNNNGGVAVSQFVPPLGWRNWDRYEQLSQDRPFESWMERAKVNSSELGVAPWRMQ